MITLFRCATGEDWFCFMFDLGRTEKNGCIPGETCGARLGTSIAYFLSFIMICSFIMLNLFILIIIEYFENFNLVADNPLERFNNNVD